MAEWEFDFLGYLFFPLDKIILCDLYNNIVFHTPIQMLFTHLFLLRKKKRNNKVPNTHEKNTSQSNRHQHLIFSGFEYRS